MSLQAYGVSVEPLRGWDGEIYRRAPEALAPEMFTVAGGVVETTTPIIHLANFPLPAERGDYGGGAVELMGSGGIFVALLAHDPADAATPLFEGRGIPWPLSAHDFEPQQMQRTIPGQAGCQRFFLADGGSPSGSGAGASPAPSGSGAGATPAPWCLYVAIGSYALRAVLVGEVNAALAQVQLG